MDDGLRSRRTVIRDSDGNEMPQNGPSVNRDTGSLEKLCSVLGTTGANEAQTKNVELRRAVQMNGLIFVKESM